MGRMVQFSTPSNMFLIIVDCQFQIPTGVRDRLRKDFSFGLVYKISDHFSCRIVFMNPIQKMLRSVGVIPNSGTESIGFIRNRVNKTPIQYEIEFDTLVIRCRVNGAFICSVHLCKLLTKHISCQYN